VPGHPLPFFRADVTGFFAGLERICGAYAADWLAVRCPFFFGKVVLASSFSLFDPFLLSHCSGLFELLFLSALSSPGFSMMCYSDAQALSIFSFFPVSAHPTLTAFFLTSGLASSSVQNPPPRSESCPSRPFCSFQRFLTFPPSLYTTALVTACSPFQSTLTWPVPFLRNSRRLSLFSFVAGGIPCSFLNSVVPS